MRLISLSLRGHVGIERGLGVDQIDIDFTQFGEGVIALAAENGRGKSTVLESCTPFRTLVSRPGALQNHCYLRDSHRILIFEMNGSIYEAKILIDAQAGKQEAVISRDGVPLNDSKTSTYDSAIREIFGSEDLFFRSLFRGQNAESITDLRASDRKALFVELLGLAHIEAYHEAAKGKANGHLREIDDLRARIETMREQAGDAVSLRADLDTAEIELRLASENLETARATVKDAEEAERKAKEALTAFDGLRTERDTLKAKAADADMKALNADVELGQQAKRHETELQPLRDRIARAEKILANTAQIDEKLAELKDLRESATSFESAREKQDAAARELSEKRERLTSMQAHYDQSVRDAEGVLRDAQAKLTAAQERYTRLRDLLEEKIVTAQKAAALLDQVPCNGMDLAGKCYLLASARESRDSIAGLQADLESLITGDAVTSEREYLAEADAALERVKSGSPTLDAARADTEAAQQALDATPYDSGTHMALNASIRTIEAQQWDRLKIEADTAAQTKADTEADIAAAEKRQRTERAAAENALLAHRNDVGFYTEEIEKIEEKLAGEGDAKDAVEGAKDILDGANYGLTDCERYRVAADQEVTRIRTRLEAAEAAEAKSTEMQTALEAATSVHSRWALLARATGKDGIQALELDAAGPNVSAIANELLADTFGSQFQIAFETTRLSADGKKQIETFEIKVLADGTEQTIENLSGGQRVWVEAAIAQAIAIYLRRKSSLDLRTSFLDEADGALDSGNAFKYLSMLRSAHELAGIHHTILITHRQELLAHIPQQIRLVPGVGIEYVN